MLRNIADRAVGTDAPVFVIAEIGLNHGGSLPRALAMVDAAARAGASAVKLQTLVAADLVAPSCPPPAHVSVASLRDFFARFELDADAHRALAARARSLGLAFISTPFSLDAVGLLDDLDVDALKIASGDLTNAPLIAAAARTGRPLIISTGMGVLPEVRDALDVVRDAGNEQVAVLHCVSAYPTPAGAQNLRAIATLERTFGIPVGLSDHAADTAAAPLAVALGAVIYERHLMLDGHQDAIDAPVSSTPDELAAAIVAMADARVALGDGRKICLPAERPNVTPSRRGLYARRTLPAGSRVDHTDVIALRPASALSPSDLPGLIGTTLTRAVAAGQPFLATDLSLERAS